MTIEHTDLEEDDPGRPSLSDNEYTVAQYWYKEWSTMCKLIATLAFAAIAVTLAARSGDDAADLFDTETLKWAWFAFGAGGAFAGVGVLVSYIWMDCANRMYAPGLKGKLLREVPHWLLDQESPTRLGTLGWVAAVLAVGGIIAGLVLTIMAAWMR